MTPDTPTAYGTISRLLHWSMAGALAAILTTVLAWKLNEDYFYLINYHKAIGFVLMLLIVLRLLWTAANCRRRPHNNLAVKLGHGLLYALMLVVPALGLLRQYASAHGSLEIAGITVLPAAAERIELWVQLGNMAHGKLAWLLFILIAGHIAAALFHQIRGEKMINRMAGKR